jgi:hypothetical protein
VTAPARYRLSDLVFESDRPLPELVESPSDAESSVEVRVAWHAAESAPLTGTTFSAWLTADGDEWLTFADAANGYLLTFPEHGQFAIASDASSVSVHPFARTPDETTRHLLLNQILPLVMSRRGRLVLHASAISYHDEVVAFIGRSGAGKSTFAVACALAGASIVSDDCLVVNHTAGRWEAVPCRAGVRLWPGALELFGWNAESGAAAAHYSDKRRLDDRNHHLVFETRTLPLAAICYLTPPSAWESPTASLADGGRAGALRGRDAVMALASELFRLDCRDETESRRQFDVVATMAGNIPIEIPARARPDASAAALLCRMSNSWRRSP